MQKNSSAYQRCRHRCLFIGRVLVFIFIVLMTMKPEYSASQTDKHIRTHLGRYVVPTIAGELVGTLVGAVAGRLLFYDKYGDTWDFAFRSGGITLLGSRIGGIVGASAVAHDWKSVLFYNTITHAAIVGGVFLASPDWSNHTAAKIGAIYLLTAPFLTMSIASIVDSAYATNQLRVAVQPRFISDENRLAMGVSLRLTGL